jgi:hypothetical protein
VDGFDLTVNYNRYQFIPESDALATTCRSALLANAHRIAQQKGRSIKPINEQQVEISMGRNGFTGRTSCSAFVPAYFQDDDQ